MMTLPDFFWDGGLWNIGLKNNERTYMMISWLCNSITLACCMVKLKTNAGKFRIVEKPNLHLKKI